MDFQMKSERIYWIDAARCIAIICVVLCHTSEIYFFWSGEDIFSYSWLLQAVSFTTFTIGRLGVPLFLFISGYLLLDRDYDDPCCIRFWKRNLVSLLFTTEIWIVLYYIFLSFYNHQSLLAQVPGLLASMLFLNDAGFPHYWYLPMILGIYLILPLVSNAIRRLSLRTLLVPLSISAVFLFGLPTINVLLQPFANGLELNTMLSLDFSGGVYGIYLISGYLFKRYLNINRKISIPALLLLGISTVSIQIILLNLHIRYLVWYDFLPLGAAAFFLFAVIKNAKIFNKNNRIISSLSACSFGIYLIHYPVIYVIRLYLPLGHLSLISRVAVLFLSCLALSWGLSILIARLPVLNRLLILYHKK